jgi:four helix bundle protein
MSRDHRKLRVFHDAHSLVLNIYQQTRDFPRDEWYGVGQQMRRAAVSVPTNIVEGCARIGSKEYCNFLNVALGSACELAYLVQLSEELRLTNCSMTALSNQSDSVVRQLKRLVAEAETFATRGRKSRTPQISA